MLAQGKDVVDMYIMWWSCSGLLICHTCVNIIIPFISITTATGGACGLQTFTRREVTRIQTDIHKKLNTILL